MSGLQGLASEKIWFDKYCYDKAETQFYENIQQEQNRAPSHGGDQGLMSHIEPDNLEALHSVVVEIATAMQKPEITAAMLDQSIASTGSPPSVAAPVQVAPAKELRVKNDDNDNDDNDIDLFGCDKDDKETANIKQERLDACDAKKAKELISIAKSSIILDIKPWDDETDMVMLEDYVRSLQMDGLLWGASRLMPVGYGIKKLQINCVVEDEKVGTEILEEEITKFEDYVQSVDVVAFNKI